jgi:hypothetical protein
MVERNIEDSKLLIRLLQLSVYAFCSAFAGSRSSPPSPLKPRKAVNCHGRKQPAHVQEPTDFKKRALHLSMAISSLTMSGTKIVPSYR